MWKYATLEHHRHKPVGTIFKKKVILIFMNQQFTMLSALISWSHWFFTRAHEIDFYTSILNQETKTQTN